MKTLKSANYQMLRPGKHIPALLLLFFYCLCIVHGAELKSITLAIDTKNNFGTDGYILTIMNDTALITAKASTGIFYGIQTLRQLLPAKIETLSSVSGVLWTVPGVTIADSARFLWRGVMLDCGRHYFPPAAIKRQIDLMSIYKLNRFHWHLTDDQGWRIEIKAYPTLADSESYTQEDAQEIVEYAAARNIMVIPEIEMPGHGVAALRKFPSLSCTGGPIPDPSEGGVHDDVFCAGNDSVFVFLENVLSEITGIFPCQYVHIGGDEVSGVRWNVCSRCQSRMDSENIDDSYGLQTWFMHRIADFLREKGRTTVGWEEILYGGAPDGSFVQSWKEGGQSAVDAAESGHGVIISTITDMYSWFGNFAYLPLQKMYSFEPVPDNLELSHTGFIAGAEHCIWTEFIDSEEKLDNHAWPRNCALAELDWTPAVKKDWNDFKARMSRHYSRFENAGVSFYRDSLVPDDTSLSFCQIIPAPVSVSLQPDTFLLTANTVINVSDSTKFAGEYFASAVKAATGFALKVDESLPANARAKTGGFKSARAYDLRHEGQWLVLHDIAGTEALTVQLYDVSGKIVSSASGNSHSRKLRIKVSHLPPGVYICSILTDEKETAIQVIIVADR